MAPSGNAAPMASAATIFIIIDVFMYFLSGLVLTGHAAICIISFAYANFGFQRVSSLRSMTSIGDAPFWRSNDYLNIQNFVPDSPTQLVAPALITS